MKIAILISGGGTTAESIIRSTEDGVLAGLVKVACVIASNPECRGTAKASCLGIPTRVINPRSFTSPNAFGSALLSILIDDYAVDKVGQHGWMPLTPGNVISSFPGKILNQHPGPLDPGHADFGGVNPGMFGARVSCARLFFCRKVKDPGGDWTEATVHLVEETVDTGLLVHTERVPIEPKDNVADLQARLLQVEHRVCIEAWRQMATGAARPRLREERLVQWEHLPVLVEAKENAALLYPRG